MQGVMSVLQNLGVALIAAFVAVYQTKKNHDTTIIKERHEVRHGKHC